MNHGPKHLLYEILLWSPCVCVCVWCISLFQVASHTDEEKNGIKEKTYTYIEREKPVLQILRTSNYIYPFYLLGLAVQRENVVSIIVIVVRERARPALIVTLRLYQLW